MSYGTAFWKVHFELLDGGILTQSQKLDIVFQDAEGTGEGVADEGGPTKEFLRLLMRDIHTSDIFEGADWNKVLLCNCLGEFITTNSNCFC